MTSGVTTPSSSTNPTGGPSYSFEGFLDGWFHRQDQLLAEITAAVAVGKGEARSCDGGGGGSEEVFSEREANELVSRALAHFEEYYEQKSRAAHQDVFSLFSPPWCSSFECAFLWTTGFRPSVLLQLVSDSIHDLSDHQTQSLDSLKRETRTDEKQIADELARIQESAAAPPIIDFLRGASRLHGRQSFNPTTSEPIDQLQVALEVVVDNADTLRLTTAAGVAEILTPVQGLRFLAAAFRLQQGMRSLGIERDHLSSRTRP